MASGDLERIQVLLVEERRMTVRRGGNSLYLYEGGGKPTKHTAEQNCSGCGIDATLDGDHIVAILGTIDGKNRAAAQPIH
jgi:hypothetical protein